MVSSSLLFPLSILGLDVIASSSDDSGCDIVGGNFPGSLLLVDNGLLPGYTSLRNFSSAWLNIGFFGEGDGDRRRVFALRFVDTDSYPTPSIGVYAGNWDALGVSSTDSSSSSRISSRSDGPGGVNACRFPSGRSSSE